MIEVTKKELITRQRSRELDAGRRHDFSEFSIDIKTADVIQLYTWSTEIGEALARARERLQGPIDEEIGPDNVEYDPLLRVVLHAGINALFLKQFEIDSERMRRPDHHERMGAHFSSMNEGDSTGEMARLDISEDDDASTIA